MKDQNKIRLEKNGVIAVETATQSPVHIDTNNAEDILAKLRQLERPLLDALRQVAQKEGGINDIFSTLLSDQLSSKNAVGGSITQVGRDVTIGDHTSYSFSINVLSPQHKIIPKELTFELPRLRADQIIGRTSDLKDLHRRLFNQQQVVLVNGMGGVGKTTLAQVYCSAYYEQYAHIAWVSMLTEDFVNDLVTDNGLLTSLNIEPGNKTPDEVFREMLMAMKTIKDSPCLLVIDNATKTLAQHYNALPSQPNWHLLVTSREKIPYFEEKKLGFLSPDEAVLLFKSHYGRRQLEDEFIGQLVAQVQYHTLTIEILAKTAHIHRNDPKTLLKAIEDDMPTELEDVRHADRTIERITSYLISIFRISDLNETEKALFRQLIC
ncbi:MAG: NB-ARC domain-containing protein, partial [Bacteroidota bacterium]